jgi:hypothetical protein
VRLESLLLPVSPRISTQTATVHSLLLTSLPTPRKQKWGLYNSPTTPPYTTPRNYQRFLALSLMNAIVFWQPTHYLEKSTTDYPLMAIGCTWITTGYCAAPASAGHMRFSTNNMKDNKTPKLEKEHKYHCSQFAHSKQQSQANSRVHFHPVLHTTRVHNHKQGSYMVQGSQLNTYTITYSLSS